MQSILVVGGGVAGMTFAVAARRHGCHVTLLELNPRVEGAGLGLSSNCLIPLRELGLLPDILSRSKENIHLYVRDAHGKPVADVLRPADPMLDAPVNVVISRPDLAAVLDQACARAHVKRLTGHSVVALTNRGDGVDVAFTDGGGGRFDLVVGADGINSTVRALAFGAKPVPEPAGQAGWRWLMESHPDIERGQMLLGSRGVKAGFYPLPGDRLYAFITQPLQADYRDPVAGRHALIDTKLAAFDVPFVTALRAKLPADEQIYFGPFARMLMPAPWNRGRVVLIGDAAHAMPPHASSGAAMAIEDAWVLAECIGAMHSSSDWERAASAFIDRRFERVRRVFETSVANCEAENAQASDVPPPAPDPAHAEASMQAFWRFLREPL